MNHLTLETVLNAISEYAAEKAEDRARNIFWSDLTSEAHTKMVRIIEQLVDNQKTSGMMES